MAAGVPARDDPRRAGAGAGRATAQRRARRRRRSCRAGGGRASLACGSQDDSPARRGWPRDRRRLRLQVARLSVGSASQRFCRDQECQPMTDARRDRVLRYGRAMARWTQLLVGRTSRPGIRVFYGHDEVPAEGEAVAGGSAKVQRLAMRFPNQPTDFSILYLGSTWLPRDLRPLLWHAHRRRTPFLLNQNGVGYPGWAGSGHRCVQPSAASRPRAGRPRPVSERVLQTSRGPMGDRAGGLVGDPSQRRRRSTVHARRRTSTGRARAPTGWRSVPGVQARTRDRDARGTALCTPGSPSSLSPVASSHPSSR